MDCSICFCEIEDKDKIITNCKHIYHKKCLERWFKINHRCPLCRESKFKISVNQYSKNYWERKIELENEINLCNYNLFKI